MLNVASGLAITCKLEVITSSSIMSRSSLVVQTIGHGQDFACFADSTEHEYSGLRND